ncbi:hypothetical protein [Sphingobacterium hotanense]|nr:hypothetical protein [Sphingobacterium hotanense]
MFSDNDLRAAIDAELNPISSRWILSRGGVDASVQAEVAWHAG